MAVLLANTTLTLRRKTHKYGKDAHGVRVAAPGWSTPAGPFPAAVTEPERGPTDPVPWRIRADVRLHPITPDDELTDGEGRKFIVRTARRTSIPGYGYVDYIAVTGELTPPYVP